MGPTKLIASTRRKPKKRVRLAKSRARPLTVAPQLEPGAPSDLDLMRGIQAEDPDALSQLYDRYNGILKALILRVIHNEAEADDLRKKQAYARAEERLQNETEQQPDAWVHNATEEEIVLSDTRALIQKVIAGLPPPQQQAIDLAFFKGMSQREIAAKTNTPLGTVKTRLELGLKKIYDGLKELRDEL